MLDFNLIDPHHLEAYNEKAVNYNRDVESFPILKKILQRIQGKEIMYKSPTDMGVNRAGFSIINDEKVKEAAKQEIIRRYFRHTTEYIAGVCDKKSIDKLQMLMEVLDIKPEDRPVVLPARKAAIDCEKKNKGNHGIYCGAAIQLKDGSIVTGKNSKTIHVASSVILNAIKVLAGIPDNIHLLSPQVLESINTLKADVFNSKTVNLNLNETLIALSICAASNPSAQVALEKLQELRNREMHTTHIPTVGDEAGLRKLGINVTSDPNFSTKGLFSLD